ncbi:MAG TPA: hypothetical protein PLF41_09535, partial [Anaerolineales bacterium]|nr:hypothetical protein [Anaerolineales bacterium]
MTTNAPTLWILVPFGLGILLLFIRNARTVSALGGALAVLLALAAQFIPIETALRFGELSIKIDSSISVLGRILLISPAEGSLLALIYAGSSLWFFGSLAAERSARVVPVGLMITALMVAALAVQPFLYA